MRILDENTEEKRLQGYGGELGGYLYGAYLRLEFQSEKSLKYSRAEFINHWVEDVAFYKLWDNYFNLKDEIYDKQLEDDNVNGKEEWYQSRHLKPTLVRLDDTKPYSFKNTHFVLLGDLHAALPKKIKTKVKQLTTHEGMCYVFHKVYQGHVELMAWDLDCSSSTLSNYLSKADKVISTAIAVKFLEKYPKVLLTDSKIHMVKSLGLDNPMWRDVKHLDMFTTPTTWGAWKGKNMRKP